MKHHITFDMEKSVSITAENAESFRIERIALSRAIKYGKAGPILTIYLFKFIIVIFLMVYTCALHTKAINNSKFIQFPRAETRAS